MVVGNQLSKNDSDMKSNPSLVKIVHSILCIKKNQVFTPISDKPHGRMF